jgi:ankyrin repeat protein/tetratricopeptide (TPR) repeat protein
VGLYTEIASLLKQSTLPAAKFDLGICYFRGRGVDRNIQEAARLVQLAATLGDPRAEAISCRFHSALGIPTTYQSALDRELEGLPPNHYYSTRVRKYEQLQNSSITRNISKMKLGSDVSGQQMACTGNIARVQELLTAGFDINSNTPGNLLLAACRGGNRNMVDFLLQKGANARTSDEDGTTPLHWMIMFEDSELDAVIASLLAHGADIEATTRRYVQLEEHSLRLVGTPLKFAVSVRNLKLVKALLKAGASMDKTPSTFDVAVSNHCPEIVSFFISQGVKLTLHNICSASPLKLLLMHGTFAQTMLEWTIDKVLKSGASINEQDDEGRTALANALKANDSLGEIEALIKRGASYKLDSTYLVKILGQRSNPGATTEFLLSKGLLKPTPEFVNVVARRGEFEILESLLKFGIDVNETDGSVSALQAATSIAGNARILHLLLDHGANINKEFNGGTVLEACISLQVSDGEMIDALIERGAPLMSSSHITIMHRAASFHSMVDGTHVICHLLRHEMVKDLLYVGSEGRSLNTPLYNACYHGIFEAVQAILEEDFEMNRFEHLGGPISITELKGGVPVRSNFTGERDIYISKLKAEDILMALYDKMNPLHGKTRLQIAAKLANYDRVVELLQGGVEVSGHYPEKGLIESQIVMHLDAPFNQGSDYEARLLEERRVIDYLLERWTTPKAQWDPILEDSPRHLQQKYLQLIEASRETSGEGLETIALMSKLGEAYALANKWGDVEPIFRKVLEVRESKLEKNDMILFESRLNYVRTLTALNRLKEARALACTTLSQALEYLPPGCHYITMTKHDIAVIDVAEGQVSNGNEIRESLLQLLPKERTSETYIDELNIKSNLIDDYCKLERWDDASKLGIEFRKFQAESKDYPQIMQLQITVGAIFNNYSRWEDANYIFQEVLKYARLTRPRSYFELLALIALVEHWKLQKNYRESAKWQLEVLEISPTVMSQMKLTEIYDADGRLIEAGLAQKQAVDNAITILGEDHATILILKKKLCKNLQKQGLYVSAEPLARDIVARSTEDKEVAEYQLALILVDMKKYDEAAALVEHIIQTDSSVSLKLFLTRIYLHQGRIDDAELTCKSALSKAESAPEPDEWTIEALSQLAAVYIDREDIQASCDALTRALDLARRSQPDAVFDLMLSLSYDLSALSQYDKAAVLQLELLEILSSRPSVDPIELLKTKLALGTSYHNTERFEEGLKLCEEAHTGITELLGDTDDLSIEVKRELMEIYFELERWEEAKPFAEDVLRSTRDRVEDCDPEAIAVISFLSRIYQELELWIEAGPLFEVLLKASRDGNGDDHNETIVTMELLAESYQKGKKFKAAEELMIGVVEKRSRILGETHEDTIDAMEMLFDLHESTHAFTEAENIGLRLLRLYDNLQDKDGTKIRNRNFSLARVYRKHRNFNEAEAIAWRIYNMDEEPCVDAVRSLGYTYYELKRYDLAEPFFLKLLALQTQNAAKSAAEGEPTSFDLNVVKCWKVLASNYLYMERWSVAKHYAELSLLGRQYFVELRGESDIERKGDIEVLSAMLVLQEIYRAEGDEDQVEEMGRQVRQTPKFMMKRWF